MAVGVFVLVALGSLRSLIGERSEGWGVTALGWALIGVSCGALYFRRRWPVAVGGFVWAASGAYYLVSTYDGPLMAAFAVALYTVAAEGRLRAAVALAALAVIGTGLGTLAGNHTVNGVALFMLTGWLVGTVALGWARHTRLAHAREAERRAATEERLRIARELHDVVGHHLSLINVQAAAALRRTQKRSGSGEEALAAIKESSREALRELRATLGVLRQVDEAAPTAPPAGLDRLDDLVAGARRAGLEVETYRSGVPWPLPTELDLAAYRILQESLTNVARHARATTVTVRVEHAPDHLALEVADDGRAAPGPYGSGIVGMRERARALGGELAAGPGPGGGFAVRARLPLPLPRTAADGAS
ncbi:sensor histidine kinase [Streptomyces sp. NPDC087440]|uniref:sensor histidine kinase n=1 Tax=Streptomyces sp. NPDC087440 TaxID=3365790 RepID=UPI003802444A